MPLLLPPSLEDGVSLLKGAPTMKENPMSRSLTLSIAAVGLLLSGAAIAQAVPPAGSPMRENARPEMTRAAVQERAAQMFARLDANTDGKIDAADRVARNAARNAARNTGQTTAQATDRTSARFARLDTNADGAISAEEFAAPGNPRRGRMGAGRAAADGEVRAEARAEARPEGQRGMRRMARQGDRRGAMGNARAVLGQADTDNDGTVSQGEFSAAMLARFDAADADANGIVSPEERRAARPEGRRGGQTDGRRNPMHGQRGSSG